MPTVKVIRILQYEGTEEAVRKAIQLSKSLGVHQYSGYQMTVAEHINELPELVEVPDERVQKVLEGELILSTDTAKQDKEQTVERHARVIYNSWLHSAGWVPWDTGGNPPMQDRARSLARVDLQVKLGSFKQ